MKSLQRKVLCLGALAVLSIILLFLLNDITRGITTFIDPPHVIEAFEEEVQNNKQATLVSKSIIFKTKLAKSGKSELTKPKKDTLVSAEEPFRYYGEFRRLNDNLTYVYVGYYDDRDEEAVVKIIAEIPGKIDYNFSCTVYYPDRTVFEVTGYVKYLYVSTVKFVVNNKFRNGYIICPVSKQRGAPKSLWVGRSNGTLPKVKVTVKSPSKEKYKLTRCISPLFSHYTNVPQLIWSIEFQRMFGVEKTIVYLDSQSKEVEEVLHSYESDGIVELRNFSINQPGTPIGTFMNNNGYWGQWLAFNDCVLSQIKSAKYVILTDIDEGFVPRKHETIWGIADDIFERSKHDSKPAGALLFRNVYYPTFKNMTKNEFLHKDLAIFYKIDPLLYTTRMKTNAPYVFPKALVRPETVELMFIHYVVDFKKNAWVNKVVDEEIATNHHYREEYKKHMHPPETEDDFVIQFSDKLSMAVKVRIDRTRIQP